jgi:hypothetical protein
VVCDGFSWLNYVRFCLRFSAYARRRYGAVDTHADNAWQLLKVALGFTHPSFSFWFYLLVGAHDSVVVKAYTASRKVTGSSPDEVDFLN